MARIACTAEAVVTASEKLPSASRLLRRNAEAFVITLDLGDPPAAMSA